MFTTIIRSFKFFVQLFTRANRMLYLLVFGSYSITVRKTSVFFQMLEH